MTALAWGQSKLLSHETEIDNIIKGMTLGIMSMIDQIIDFNKSFVAQKVTRCI